MRSVVALHVSSADDYQRGDVVALGVFSKPWRVIHVHTDLHPYVVLEHLRWWERVWYWANRSWLKRLP